MELATILDILKVAVGLTYLYLEYHAHRGLWIASVVMPAIGIWLFYSKGLYADCGINMYYLVMAVYGWIAWSRGAGAKAERPITRIRPLPACLLAAAWLCLWALIAWFLATFTDSSVVWLDSFTTSLSAVGLWMLAHKYVEQWWIWFVVDAVYVYLYYHKGIYFSGSLYAFYTVMAVLGYFKWRRLMKAEPLKIDSPRS